MGAGTTWKKDGGLMFLELHVVNRIRRVEKGERLPDRCLALLVVLRPFNGFDMEAVGLADPVRSGPGRIRMRTLRLDPDPDKT